MIKVIQVITDTNIGGAGIWLLNFLKTYDRTLLDMMVVLPHDSLLKPKIEALKVRIREADGIADCSFSIQGIKSLDFIFKEERPELIHTHASLSARLAARKNRIKVVHTRHCLEEEKKYFKKYLYKTINNALSDRVIGVSRAVCENLEVDGIYPEKLRMVYNGIFPLTEIPPQEKAALRKRYGIADPQVIVGIVARLEPVKNHVMLIEAAQAVITICPQAVFMIVGTGSLEKELKLKVEATGLADKFIFTGYVDPVNDIMNIIDVHVLTSTKEALSISLIEAMSLGKPIVATDSGGPGEVVHNGISGILVGSNDLINLTMGIVRFIQRPDLAKAAGMAGKQIVGEKFLAENMARKIEDIYNELIQAERK